MKPVTIDFETARIEPRPAYPPVPVGVSIKRHGKPAKYWAWGHPSGNNCTQAQAGAALRAVWNAKDGILCHHSHFDFDVAETHFGLSPPQWQRAHDTVFLLYLDDPHARELGLKPAADRLLGMPPEERDDVVEWLVAHQPAPGVKISRAPKSPHYAGGYVALAPAGVVAPYANGDAERTEALFDLLHPRILARGMGAAYDRERQLSPILLDMERRGVPVDLPRLDADIARYEAIYARLDGWARNRLKTGPGTNLVSGAQLVAALLAAGLADPSKMGVTATGRVAADKTAISAGVSDRQLAATLKYMTQLRTCLNTFMVPWRDTARRTKGLIYTHWNQTRSDSSGGTRTGRLSSSPNFQNIPRAFDPLFSDVAAGLPQPAFLNAPGLPRAPIADLLSLPLCRDYIMAPRGRVLVGRDYQSQELRVLAHFENGALFASYGTDPWLDVHAHAGQLLTELLGRVVQRTVTKILGFSTIYGAGVGRIAEQLSITVDAARQLKQAYLQTFPDLKAMYADMKARAKCNVPIRTWGGREYYCEPAIVKDGRYIEFDYKMVNVLVQGSSADCTKEAMIRYHASRPAGHYLMLSVHDELIASAPARELARGHAALRAAMEGVKFDVPMLSEGKWSAGSWGQMQPYDKKGVRV